MRQVEEENLPLKKQVTGLSLEKAMGQVRRSMFQFRCDRRHCAAPANQMDHRNLYPIWLPQGAGFAETVGRAGAIIISASTRAIVSRGFKRPHHNKSALKRQPQHHRLWLNHILGRVFVSDAVFDGRWFRLLTVIDLYMR